MPAFQAINLEPEENVDEQVDTAKELHVDEALKRFQIALKLHAQGPRARAAAGEAYLELFRSEIFNYRVAKSDYERADQQAGSLSVESLLGPFAATLDADTVAGDGATDSLSQALYLSYKNYGQYWLDKIKDSLRSDQRRSTLRLRYRDDEGKPIIDNWTAALDQDPSDPELWRRVARFAGSMSSGRIKRYCLEAAIELDDDPAAMDVEPPSLAEALAGEQLKMYLRTLNDTVALSHPAMTPWMEKGMPDMMRRYLDPIPFLPDPSEDLAHPVAAQPKSTEDTSEGVRLEDDNELTDAEDSDKERDDELESVGASWSELGLRLIRCMQDTKRAIKICRMALGAARVAKLGSTGNGSELHTAENHEGVAKSTERLSDDTNRPGAPEENGRASQTTDNKTKVSSQSLKDYDLSTSFRKRSQSVAGLPEVADEDNVGEKRSKRVRRRTEIKDVEEPPDPSALMADQMQVYQAVDLNLFNATIKTLKTLDVEDSDAFGCLQELLDSCEGQDRTSKVTSLGGKDLRCVMTAFNDDLSAVLLNKKEQATLGLSSFLEHAKSGSQEKSLLPAFDEKEGLIAFTEMVSSCAPEMTSDDIALEWVRRVSRSYATTIWSDVMKVTVVQLLNRTDAILFRRIHSFLEQPPAVIEKSADLGTMVLMLFELHVDIYERITNPSSVVDYATRMETKHRLDRWLHIASSFVRITDRPADDPLCIRFMWAATLTSSLADNPIREHILLLWTSLRDFLSTAGVKRIELPNNVVMPLISAAAADREISKLTTMDFFLGLFQDEMEDPVQVIETLEPVLNPSSVCTLIDDTNGCDNGDGDTLDKNESPEENGSLELPNGKRHRPVSQHASQSLQDLWKFLSSSSTELRLFLWSRLGDAYAAIQYHTKRLSCILKSIEMIIADLTGETYAKTPDESRRFLFMRALKSLDELLIQSLSMGLNESSAFEIIDRDHIKTSAAALAKLTAMLHVVTLCEDEIRIGMTASPSSATTFPSFCNKLREVQVRAWCMQYTLFKAGLPQQDGVTSVENHLADFLATIHRAIGVRKFCKSSNKIFLKMMRVELLKGRDIENWEDYLGQVLYDLHGLKLGVGVWEVQDHGCTHDKLERRQAMQLVEKVMILARRMPMKDLLKSDLKTTIEHLQQAIGQTKSTPQMIHNLRNFTEILKKPIHPLRLYQALSGGVSIDAVGVNIPEAALAKQGWFFMLGMIALTKFKGVDLNRRQTPGATDDLRIGATFLRLQLQFTADNWQAWFRLAECFDYELDEAVLWTADKINKDRSELVKFQRNAIHCYTLALSNSRHVEVDLKDGDALHDLYHKFAMRLYSSSREPFAMEPFKHSDQERFFIEGMGASTFRKILHDEMSKYKVWKFAAKLFRMARARKPDDWMNPYMLAKCYWKMYQTPADLLDKSDKICPITKEQLLETLQLSIQVAKSARKSRNSDPILEPHYKIVSVLHKMVTRGDVAAGDAASLLATQPFGVSVNPPDASFSEPQDWKAYITRNLVHLRDRDKSNWHHRIVMRHAKIVFPENDEANSEERDSTAAQASFAILKENMFTKTMVMNVWKCDAERPGRHHVFTEQYVRFMTGLLLVLSDRTNLELLLRRLRKKGADFYHFSDLWQSCCLAYLKLLRADHGVNAAPDDPFKSLPSEEFDIIGERIVEWAAGDGQHSKKLNCMKEAVELKKLNANLMKVTAVDDLINDCYSKIYLDLVGKLPGLEPSQLIAERNQAKEVDARLEAVVQAESKPPSSLSSILNSPNGREGPGGSEYQAGTSTPMDVEKLEAAPRGRRTVRRPDVLRKAEQAVLRSLETPHKSSASKSRVGSLSSKPGSRTPAIAQSDAGSVSGDEDDEPDAQASQEARDMDEEMRDVDGAGKADYDDEHGDGREEGKDDTEVGSIHDSADDESDLSDLPEGYDEEPPPGLMFPNLERPRHDDDGDGDEDEGGDEGGDGIDHGTENGDMEADSENIEHDPDETEEVEVEYTDVAVLDNLEHVDDDESEEELEKDDSDESSGDTEEEEEDEEEDDGEPDTVGEMEMESGITSEAEDEMEDEDTEMAEAEALGTMDGMETEEAQL